MCSNPTVPESESASVVQRGLRSVMCSKVMHVLQRAAGAKEAKEAVGGRDAWAS